MTAPTPKPLRVLLVDDSEVVRMGLRALLDATPDIEVIAEADSVATAVQTAIQYQPDVVLLDIRLPDGMGYEACRPILRQLPETRILVLTSVVEDRLVNETVRAGAHGYLLKEINAQGLVKAIHDVAAGGSILDPAVTARVLQLIKGHVTPSDESTFALLSSQERRVLALIAEGLTNKEVAMEMHLAEKTVKNYLSTVFEKLHVTRRSQAAALYAQLMHPRH